MTETTKYRILAVDDSYEDIDIILNCFSKKYIVHVADSGESALELLNKVKPDIVLLDIIMPGMDGYEVCAHIKDREDLKDIPVLFLTAKTDSDEVVAGFKAGAADYITKPFNLDELSARVELHLDAKKSRDTILQKSLEQSELLHILHHDLSNTFMSLSAMIHFLESDPDWTSPFLEQIKGAVKNGCDIINMVRILGETDFGSLDLSAVNLKDSLDKSYAILEHMFSAKNIKLNLNVDPECTVYAEESSLINSVLNNLLTNAVKFSFPGSVIDLSMKESGDDIQLSFEDRGIGIPEYLLNNIFDPGKSTSRSGTNGERGTGFGMPLVKKFLEYYKADVSISSREIDKYPDTHGTVINICFKKAVYASE